MKPGIEVSAAFGVYNGVAMFYALVASGNCTEKSVENKHMHFP